MAAFFKKVKCYENGAMKPARSWPMDTGHLQAQQKKPESWTLASTHLSGSFVAYFQLSLLPQGIFGGLKISEPSHASRFNI